MTMRFLVASVLAACVLPGFVGAAEATAPEGNVAHLKRLEEQVDKPWANLLSQNGIDLVPGENYRLTFWAKSAPGLLLRISTKLDQPPWRGMQDQRVQLDTEWRLYEVSLTAKDAEPGHTRLEFRYGGPETGEIWIADISLKPEGAEESSKNLIVNHRFEDKLLNWYTEGQKPGVFVVEIQTLAEAAGTTP